MSQAKAQSATSDREGGFEARLARFLESIPDATLVVGEDGTVRLANVEAARIFGYAPEELVGISVESLVPPAERERHRQARTSFAERPRDRQMGSGPLIVAQRRDGTLVHVDIELRPRTTPSGLVTLAVIRDRGEVQTDEVQRLAREAQRRMRLVRLAAEDLAELVAALVSVLEGAQGMGASSAGLSTRLEEAQSTAFLVHELTQQLVAYGSEDLDPGDDEAPRK